MSVMSGFTLKQKVATAVAVGVAVKVLICNKRMGSFLTSLWWGGNPDEANAQSGLSRRDIHLIRQSWAKINADAVGSGTELLIRFFTAYPKHRLFFRTFKDMPAEELRQNRQFHAHCLSVIVSLNSMIENLDKPELAIVICQKVGLSHKSRKLTEQVFNDLKDVLVKLFLDLKFDDATMKSWVKAVTFIYTNIFLGLAKTEDN